MHNAYYQWQSTIGGRGDFWEARKSLDAWLTRFYIEARLELGLKGSDVFDDPEGGLPLPGSGEKRFE
jgi:hypothetical protein